MAKILFWLLVNVVPMFRYRRHERPETESVRAATKASCKTRYNRYNWWLYSNVKTPDGVWQEIVGWTDCHLETIVVIRPRLVPCAIFARREVMSNGALHHVPDETFVRLETLFHMSSLWSCIIISYSNLCSCTNDPRLYRASTRNCYVNS